MADKKFGARMSKWIAGFYVGMLVFLIALMVFVPGLEYMSDLETLLFYPLFSIVFIIIAFTLYKAYSLKIQITESHVKISGIFRSSKISISDIEEVERTPIPFGFRIFGASFLGGAYYLPGIGKATVAMTNFSDGVLIKTKEGGNFVVTPRDPEDFVESLEDKME